jgi:hypothetical protein
MKEFNYQFRKGLVVGLRSSENNQRNGQALTLSTGMYPTQGSLQSLPAISRLDTSTLDPLPVFPFPQIFELKDGTVMVCTSSEIYTYASNTFTQELGGLTPGHLWTVADFNGFLFMANGKQTVYRDGVTRVFSANDIYGMSSCSGVCNFNGQLIVAAPDTVI